MRHEEPGYRFRLRSLSYGGHAAHPGYDCMLAHRYGVNEELEIANASIIAEKCAAKSVSAAGLKRPAERAQSRMMP